MDFPGLRTPVLSILLAGLLGIAAYRGAMLPDWLRLFLAFAAAVFAGLGALTLLDWLAHRVAERAHELNTARTWGLVVTARAIQDLNHHQLDMLETYSVLSVEGILGAAGITWTVRAPGANLPLEFWQDFIEASAETWPELYSIHRHTEFADRYQWTMAEEKLTQATNALVHAGWAEKQAGRPARATKPLKWISAQFAMEMKHG